jgi:hypothetical protein
MSIATHDEVCARFKSTVKEFIVVFILLNDLNGFGGLNGCHKEGIIIAGSIDIFVGQLKFGVMECPLYLYEDLRRDES